MPSSDECQALGWSMHDEPVFCARPAGHPGGNHQAGNWAWPTFEYAEKMGWATDANA